MRTTRSASIKNILFINSNDSWGGGEKWHYNMCHSLKQLGYRTLILTNRTSELRKKALKNNIQTLAFSLGNLTFLNPFKLIYIYIHLKKLTIDTVFINLPRDIKVFVPLLSYLGVRNIIYRRGMPNPIRNTLINRYLYSKVGLIIANSAEIKKTIHKNLPELEKKIIIIYNGVEPRSHQNSIIGSPVKLGNLGRLVSQKAQLYLIKVAYILKTKHQLSFTLEIGGIGPMQRQLQDKINQLDLNDCVSLIGQTEAEIFFDKIDIFLFSSLFEGSANALIESLQFGVPAIAFDISSNPEVLEDNFTGFLIPTFNLELFAQKIVELTANKSLHNKFQLNCSKVIEEKFNFQEKIKEVILIIETEDHAEVINAKN